MKAACERCGHEALYHFDGCRACAWPAADHAFVRQPTQRPIDATNHLGTVTTGENEVRGATQRALPPPDSGAEREATERCRCGHQRMEHDGECSDPFLQGCLCPEFELLATPKGEGANERAVKLRHVAIRLEAEGDHGCADRLRAAADEIERLEHDREHEIECDQCGWTCRLNDNEHPSECPICFGDRRADTAEVALAVAREALEPFAENAERTGELDAGQIGKWCFKAREVLARIKGEG